MADTDLARRLVAACPDVWAEGMRYPPISGGTGRHAWVRGGGRVREVAHVPRDATPDLDDPATAGVLLARLWTICPNATIRRTTDGSALLTYSHGPGVYPRNAVGPTLGHACAAALVALTTPTPPPTE